MSHKQFSNHRRWLLVVLTLLVALPLLFSAGSLPAVSAQACVPRTDWPTVTVQRGDTLARIANRYGTTYPVLVTANCLTNPNRIYAGQRLYVPPAAVPNPPPTSAPIYPSDLAATYQRYQGGFMTWKAGTGEVAVYSYTDRTNTVGNISVFSAATISTLPDNPITETPPTATIRPMYAFGKVWGSFPQVRAQLGWATAAEQGYLMRVFPPYGTTYQFSLPDGRVIYHNANSTWNLSSGFPSVTPVPPPTYVPPTPTGPRVTTTQASFQPYEGGFMIWEANTGNVVAFYNNNTYTVHAASTYGRLPDNPVLDPTPAGRVRPAFGFGKVWGNYYGVRIGLGWALTGEQGYVTSFRTSPINGQSQTCFLLPDGRIISYYLRGGLRNWNYASVCP